MKPKIKDVNLTTEEVVRSLIKLGLSQNAAVIYLLLVEHKELRVAEIVRLAKIPRSSVYESLRVLENLGFTETIIDHKFVRIKPYPVSVLKHKLKEQITEVEKVEKTIRLPDMAKSDMTVVRFYKGVSGARQIFWNTLSAKETVLVYSAFGRSKFVGESFYKDFVQESIETDIKEQVLINPTERALGLIKRDNGTSLARTNIKNIRYLKEENLTIDGETFIYGNIYAQMRLDGVEISGFEIESADFVKMQRSIFNTLWKLAKPLSLYK